ncbi:hypothetical protein BDY21DRAFT_363897 [Lineolata rhizophorae]|uniref:Uncharacterized protein n=1 Tax=Lineolata rhizophorae TaxID=578093 RepID=A0A6A6P0W9_9PEZI|nr:hypothetical protein BDY21DRAFT_363897 [Lineolata rhizophorae]
MYSVTNRPLMGPPGRPVVARREARLSDVARSRGVARRGAGPAPWRRAQLRHREPRDSPSTSGLSREEIGGVRRCGWTCLRLRFAAEACAYPRGGGAVLGWSRAVAGARRVAQVEPSLPGALPGAFVLGWLEFAGSMQRCSRLVLMLTAQSSVEHIQG